MKKLLSLALAGAMCLSLFAGCSGKADPTPSSGSNPPPAQSDASGGSAEPAGLTGTLKVSMWDLSADAIFSSVIKAFEDANPGVTIEPIDIPSADYGTKLSVMLNGGSDVDVFWAKDADTTIIQVFTCSFAAYGFAKCRFRGRNTLFLIYVATIAVPWQVYMLPQYTMMNNVFHMVDIHAVLILLHSFDAFGVFLLRQFCMGIPDELLEAARIDGLSEYGIYRRIVLPQMGPSIATLVIFTFVSNWNDFMGPMIYLNSTELKTVQLGIRMFMGQYSTEYGLIMAASVVSLIPVIIVFLVFQKQFVQGIATSGLKG